MASRWHWADVWGPGIRLASLVTLKSLEIEIYLVFYGHCFNYLCVFLRRICVDKLINNKNVILYYLSTLWPIWISFVAVLVYCSLTCFRTVCTAVCLLEFIHVCFCCTCPYRHPQTALCQAQWGKSITGKSWLYSTFLMPVW